MVCQYVGHMGDALGHLGTGDGKVLSSGLGLKNDGWAMQPLVLASQRASWGHRTIRRRLSRLTASRVSTATSRPRVFFSRRRSFATPWSSTLDANSAPHELQSEPTR